MSGAKKNNKSILFTADALFAAFIIVIAISAFSQNFIQDDKTPDISYLSYDLVKGFSVIKTSELNNTYLKQLIANGTINNTNNTLLETIGELYVLNKSAEAQKLAQNISYQLIPPRYGFAIAVNDEVVYTNGLSVQKTLYTSKRLISGIEKFKPLKGSASKVYLQGLEEKKDYAYIFFGGFIGQGNISKFTDDIPSDANITDIYAEMEIGDVSGDQFNIYFNGNKCNGNYTRSSSAMLADSWDLISCKSDISPGSRNNLSLSFIPSTNFDIAYISGGFFRFEYTTKQMFDTSPEGYQKYFFSSIDGLINIYTSVYIPGNISYMNIQLKYLVNHTNSSNSTFYLKIGNTTVLQDDNSTTVQTVQLDGSVLESRGLNYSFLSGKNIPIRLGAENVSYFVQYIGTADAVLITDISGSMGREMGSDDSGTQRNCNDPQLNDSDTERLSVAKCLDKTFVRNMLNVTGNLLGLVSYEGTTDSTVSLTSNNVTLVNEIDSYSANDGTCICCGINSASSILSASLQKTIIFSSGSSWNWTNNSFMGTPDNDPSNNTWYELSYSNESQWNTGNAVLGHLAGSPTLTTDMGGVLYINASYPYMWENAPDNSTPEIDFTSGWISTNNTFGLGNGYDGWDWDTANGNGPYGWDDNVDYPGVVNNQIEFDFQTGSPARNRCSSYDCSAAYGLEINITSQLYDLINQSNGKIVVSFNYEWDGNNPEFGTFDEIWIKSRWESPTSGQHYLGTELSSAWSDTTVEVDRRNNPDTDFSGYFVTDLTSWVEGPGNYYLDLGVKLRAGDSDEWGYAMFDNISILISNSTESYYLRKHFTISDITQVKKGVMNILSDDSVTVYLNGNLIYTDNTQNKAEYWNVRGENIEQKYFRQGDNALAVELFNSVDKSRFDMELFYLNDSRNKAMVVMTDGQATSDSGCPQTGTPSEEAIEAACDARQDWGITIYAVGFSTSADEPTLSNISACGGGFYLKSDNTSQLDDFYKDVAAEIMDVSRVEQKIIISGSPTLSRLWGEDSFIEINYTPPVQNPAFGEISVKFEKPLAQNCSFLINISPKLRIIESQVSGYSSSKWFDFVYVNNVTVHNLSVFNPLYEFLGDPFIAGFNPALITPGLVDNITIRTGIEPYNITGCSKNSTFFYTGLMKATVSYSDVLEFALGCRWTVEFEDNSTTIIDVPPSYNGSSTCTYRNSSVSYNVNDTYDDAMYNLMRNLDLDDDGRLDIDLVENNLIVDAISLHKVPYPWGPAIAEVRVWQ